MRQPSAVQTTRFTTSLGRAYFCAVPDQERKAILQQIRSTRPAAAGAGRQPTLDDRGTRLIWSRSP